MAGAMLGEAGRRLDVDDIRRIRRLHQSRDREMAKVAQAAGVKIN
jgi:hypothetical protein